MKIPIWKTALRGLGATLLILLLVVFVLELAWLTLAGGLVDPSAGEAAVRQSDAGIVSLQEVSPQQAARIIETQQPQRKLFVFSLFDSWWWRNDPVDAVTSMEGMKGDGEIGGFRSVLKKKLLTVPMLMGFAGVALVGVAVFIAWKGGNVKGGLIVGGVGAALLVAAVAFEAYPEITAVLVVLAVLGGAAYALFATSFGRKLLERIGLRDHNFRQVVQGGSSFLERLSRETFDPDAGENAAIIERVTELFLARQGDAQDEETESAVHAVLNGS